MKWCSTDARIISAYPRETWLRDQRHSTFTKLIRGAPPNHDDDGDGDPDEDAPEEEHPASSPTANEEPGSTTT